MQYVKGHISRHIIRDSTFIFSNCVQNEVYWPRWKYDFSVNDVYKNATFSNKSFDFSTFFYDSY